MIMTIMGRALDVLRKKPFRLWGISLLNIVLAAVAYLAFGVIPGVAYCLVLLLNVGMTMIFLHGYRGEDEQVKTLSLFDCFRDWATAKRVLGGMLWMSLWIFLWGLIPIVGIIFATIRVYRYRLTPYILVTEPDVPATQAIKVSQQRTEGYKAKMFWTDVLIVVIPAVVMIILGLLSQIPFVGVLFGIILFVAEVVYGLFVSLYQGLVKAAYYEEISNPTLMKDGTAGKVCPNCGAKVSSKVAFCPTCGQALDEEKKTEAKNDGMQTCSVCGARVSVGASFCPNCGKSLIADPQTPAEEPASQEQPAPVEEMPAAQAEVPAEEDKIEE